MAPHRSTRFARALLLFALAPVQLACGGAAERIAPPSSPHRPEPSAAAGAASAAPASPHGTAAPDAAHGAAHPHWAYSGAEGPDHWGDLSPDWAQCRDGKAQTPIDITGATADKKLAALVFSYAPIPLRIINNGHTIQVNSSVPNFITVGSERYDLVQLHFHAPSEHTVDGKPFDMELHLVHRNAQGSLAVVGVLLKKGKESSALKPIWDHLPATISEQDKAFDGVTVDLTLLLPKNSAYSSYQGSLTTPPCTEGVTWFVLVPTAEVSEEQIAHFRSATGDKTNRPIRARNGRTPVQFKP